MRYEMKIRVPQSKEYGPAHVEKVPVRFSRPKEGSRFQNGIIEKVIPVRENERYEEMWIVCRFLNQKKFKVLEGMFAQYIVVAKKENKNG